MRTASQRLKRLERGRIGKRTEMWVDLGDGRYKRGDELKAIDDLNDPNVAYGFIVESEQWV